MCDIIPYSFEKNKKERKDMGKRRFGDRRDGRLVRDVDGLHTIMMHIMPKRTEAEVYQLYTVVYPLF